MASTGAGGPRLIELRIHGVGGSTYQEMLGPDPADPLTSDADPKSGFWALRQPVNGVERRAYLWGQVYEPIVLGLWLYLLPFTLVNVAGWTVAPGVRSSAGWFGGARRRFGAQLARWVVAFLGISLTAGWTFWMLRIVGDGFTFSDHWGGMRIGAAVVAVLLIPAYLIVRVLTKKPEQRRRGPSGAFRLCLMVTITAGLVAAGGLPFGVMEARWVALAAAAAITAAPLVLAGTNRVRFEQYRARLGGSGVARERRHLSDEETLGAPCFYDHPTDSASLLLLHAGVAVAILATAAGRIAGLSAAGSRSDQTFLDAPGAMGTPFLGHALLGVGLVQFALVVLLVVAGALGATSWSAGRTHSPPEGVGKRLLNGTVNALRPASLAGIGVFLFTGGVGSLHALAYGSFGGEPDLAKFPELELVPAFVVSALVSFVVIICVACLVTWFGGDNAVPAGRPAWSWRWFRFLRHIVGNADRLVVAAGVVFALGLSWSAVAHRGREGFRLQLVPEGEFETFEAVDFRSLRALGGVVIVLPLVIGIVSPFIPQLKSLVSSMWHVLGFWPRRFHPFGIPPEAERTVPEVQSHLLQALEDPSVRVQIVAHSQGSVIAFAALVGLRDQEALGRVSLVTLGSPLFALYPRMFPAQVSCDLTRELGDRLGAARWLNLWRPTDHFGIWPEFPPTPAPTQAEMTVSAGNRLLAHGDYLGREEVEAHITRQRTHLGAVAVPQPLPPIPSFAPRRRMVSWFDPRLLALTGYEAGVSTVFGKWADARRIQGIDGPDADIHVRPEAAEDETWIDYVADAGDAFPPTFAVAAAVAQPELTVSNEVLRRGHVLVLGGDEVYPTPSLERYANQLLGPYDLASRCAPADDQPLLLAIPGNHDWYDGLRSFGEVFCTQRAIGMWRTAQQRSYWVAHLTAPVLGPFLPNVGSPRPPTWWLWGVDLQLDNVFDERQRRFFKEKAELLQPGDLIILCSPIPTWAHAKAEPTAFDVLRDVIAEQVEPRSARVVLHVSGDSHHYVRYERQRIQRPGQADVAAGAPPAADDDLLPVQHVTAGGGGAFTSPTHHLEKSIDLPVPYHSDATKLTRCPNGQDTAHPTKGQSRRLILSNVILPRFLWRNRGFLGVPGGVAAITAYVAVFGGQPGSARVEALSPGSVVNALSKSSVNLGLILLLVVGWTAFAKPNRGKSAAFARLIGLLHGIAQLAALTGALWASTHLVTSLHRRAAGPTRAVLGVDAINPLVASICDRLALVAVAAVLGGLAATSLLALYLHATNRLAKLHDNEAASAVASMKYKHFVRIRISGGTATVWVIHVTHAKRVAERFQAHDPRPTPLSAGAPGPTVALWDTFQVGRRSAPATDPTAPAAPAGPAAPAAPAPANVPVAPPGTATEG